MDFYEKQIRFIMKIEQEKRYKAELLNKRIDDLEGQIRVLSSVLRTTSESVTALYKLLED